jgi:hypothetical protein
MFITKKKYIYNAIRNTGLGNAAYHSVQNSETECDDMAWTELVP